MLNEVGRHLLSVSHLTESGGETEEWLHNLSGGSSEGERVNVEEVKAAVENEVSLLQSISPLLSSSHLLSIS